MPTRHSPKSPAIHCSKSLERTRGYSNPARNYELKTVYVYDHAGNSEYYTSTLFGGTTDFSTMFPSTLIKLRP